MKQLLIAIATMAAMTGVHAQQAKTAATREFVKSSKKETVFLNDISMRAVRDFEKKYSKVSDGKWIKMTDGYSVKFTLNNEQYRMVYNNHGYWVYTIKYLKEVSMPREVRAQVKSIYYDYTITQVEEIEVPYNPIVYIVHMCDEKKWVNVRVRDGEMDVIQEFDKG